MDCMQEWSDRITHAQLEKVLALGEVIQKYPVEERPFQVTMMASRLFGDGIARSVEEAHYILMEAYAHAERMDLMAWYQEMIMSLALPAVGLMRKSPAKKRKVQDA